MSRGHTKGITRKINFIGRKYRSTAGCKKINNLRTELLNIVSNENNTATQPKTTNNEQNARNNESANSDENTQNFENKKQIKCDIVTLMDSNGKFLQKNRLFPNKNMYIIPCPTIQRASEILRKAKFYGQHTIIIHTGVNNVECNSPEDIAENVTNLLLFCKETYPSTKLVMSGITARKYKLLNMAVKRANELMRKELDTDQLQGVLFIDNST